MLKRLLPALGWLALPLLLHAQTAQPTPEKTAGEISKAAGPAVVLIETYGEDGKVSGSGSGFLVSSNGRILTNFHVIARSERRSRSRTTTRTR